MTRANAVKLKMVHDDGRRTPLGRLIEADDFDVVIFKLNMADVTSAVRALHGCIEAYGDQPPFLIISFSWHLGRYIDVIFAEAIRELVEIFNRDRLLLLCNMDEEMARLLQLLPGYRLVHVNNCYSLSEHEMRIEPAKKIYECVYNARPAAFKNHRLTSKLESIANISYGAEFQKSMNDFVDIGACNSGPIFWEASREEVRRVLNQSKCGLLLSSMEGACFASAEYLSCGLPVVSVPSIGGRDTFYDTNNSIIVDETPDAVFDGAALALVRLESGEFNPEDIRASFVSKLVKHRRVLSSAIAEMTGLDAGTVYNHVSTLIHRDSKLTGHINSYVTGVE